MMLSLAEIELDYRAERRAAGIAAAKRKGVYIGRKDGTTKADPARARQLHKQGLNHSEIAKAMGVSRRTVIRYLKG